VESPESPDAYADDVALPLNKQMFYCLLAQARRLFIFKTSYFRFDGRQSPPNRRWIASQSPLHRRPIASRSPLYHRKTAAIPPIDTIEHLF
jgi:hypothetical protein